jgi:hypothetical protein
VQVEIGVSEGPLILRFARVVQAQGTALDGLEQSHACELCGSALDAKRQLVDGEFSYRRTGVLARATQGIADTSPEIGHHHSGPALESS